MKNKFLLFIALLTLSTTGNAQYQLNFGLQKKQGDLELPISKATSPTTIRKTKIDKKGVLLPNTDGLYKLTEGWDMEA